ncbi:MAG: hypothetical protein ACK4SZ_13795 [Allosphingosinicella sp.]|uniref:hypothetical protein n=1 Tax=Allosphingosinicella sp. TaxID=2823234 RepID=UPI003953F40A
MSPSDEEGQLVLERWIAAQRASPTLQDVLETRDRRLHAAWIMLIFRRAKAEAVEEPKAVELVRGFVRGAYDEDCRKAEEFLRRKHPASAEDTSRQSAVQSEEGAKELVQLGRAFHGVGS